MKYRLFLWGFFIIVLINWLISEFINTLVIEIIVFGIDFSQIFKSIFITAVNLISLIILRSISKGDDEK